jgi:hypothetical protein
VGGDRYSSRQVLGRYPARLTRWQERRRDEDDAATTDDQLGRRPVLGAASRSACRILGRRRQLHPGPTLRHRKLDHGSRSVWVGSHNTPYRRRAPSTGRFSPIVEVSRRLMPVSQQPSASVSRSLTMIVACVAQLTSTSWPSSRTARSPGGELVEPTHVHTRMAAARNR